MSLARVVCLGAGQVCPGGCPGLELGVGSRLVVLGGVAGGSCEKFENLELKTGSFSCRKIRFDFVPNLVVPFKI